MSSERRRIASAATLILVAYGLSRVLGAVRELADDNLVMNERTDRFLVNGNWIELPVAGVFELRDGRIALWRDYFDLETIMKQMAPS